MDARARIFVQTRRTTRGLKRASDLLFLGLVGLLALGMLIGLAPEFEKSRKLDGEIATAKAGLVQAKEAYRKAQMRRSLLLSDPGYVEYEYRRLQPRAAKPGETLLMLSPEQRRSYEADASAPQ